MSENPEVNVQRRRKGSRPTTQAAKPIRRPTPDTGGGASAGNISGASSGAGGNSSGGGGYSSSGSSSSGGGIAGLGSLLSSGGTKGKMGCGGVVLILVAVVLFFIFSKSCSSDLSGQTPVENCQEQPSYSEPTQSLPIQPIVTEPTQIIPTRTPRPTSAPSANTGSTGNKWLVMIYQDADDQALEQDITIDLNEMERSMASTEDVMVVTQIDRFRGGFTGNSNFTGARRYLVMPDDDLSTVSSDLVMEVGEVNMADGQTLVDFVTWAHDTYPADKYMLIMSDHGMGWPGGWTDPDPGGRDGGSAPLVSALKSDAIYLNELDSALAEIQSTTNIEKFELIGLDACLMSQMEVYSMLQPYARYAVASEETEPGLGWAYSAFLSLLVYDPSTPTEQVAVNIVETYIDQDERITDDQARLEFLQQNGNSGGFFGVSRISAEQLAGQLEQSITLAAVNLERFTELQNALNTFLYGLQGIDQRVVASARSYTQSYTSIFGNQVPPSYIDLGHFVALVAKQAGDDTTRQNAIAVLQAMQNVVIAEKHGVNKPGSTGIAIYFPNSQLYGSAATGMRSYTTIANTFVRASLWDDFLAFHYAGRQFQATAAEPITATVSRIPGAGNITVSAIRASDDSVSPGEAITLSADISGENIGYIYLFTGLYDQASNSILVADTDYLESEQTSELEAVYYPDWPDAQTFTLNFEFEPLLFSIKDGTQQVLALFDPVNYGANADQAIYTVRGTYTFTETGEQRLARLYFKNENLFQVMGFKGTEEVSEASEITPKVGDTFTPSRKWLDLNANGQVTGTSYDDGETLIFGTSAWTWKLEYAPEGQYLVGFLVGDLDGNLTPAYTQIAVK
ncbi:MAG: clostripain-related cysteine peptidase [Anaerolineaceae bacterium]